MNRLIGLALGAIVLSGVIGLVVLTPSTAIPVGTAIETGNSMTDDGPDLIVYVDKEPDIGDVIVYDIDLHDRVGGEWISHRIIGESELGYLTAGDNREEPDQEIREDGTVRNDVGLPRDDQIAGVQVLRVPVDGAVGLALATLAVLLNSNLF